MVVEHVFVTTLESPAAMQAALELLGMRGFVYAPRQGFVVGETEWNSLSLIRGRLPARKARSVRELPQEIIVQYDRGRVTVAISITVNAIWGGGGVSLGFGAGVGESPRRMKLHRALLVAIANAVDRRLAQGMDPAAALAEWDEVEVRIERARKRRIMRMWLIFLLAMLFIAALITLPIYFSR